MKKSPVFACIVLCALFMMLFFFQHVGRNATFS